jgi:2-dehydro-3-deoxygalactonokinase
MSRQLLGVDWGSTNRRAYLVDADGQCLRSCQDGNGILAERGRFAESLGALCRALEVGPDVRVILSGMVGSAQGWRDAGYLDCAVPLADLPQHLVPAGPPGCFIVPGYCYRGQTIDVMRGEEIQLLGALALGVGDGMAVLPGTHSKWSELRGGQLARWSTYMTGELFALLSKGGTLASIINVSDARDDAEAFEAGVELARQKLALSHALFTVRARVVSGAMPAACARSFASGLLIGTEFVSALDGGSAGGALALVGSAALSARYATAARLFGVEAVAVDPDAAYCAALSRFFD